MRNSSQWTATDRIAVVMGELPGDLITERETAALLGVASGTLRAWRKSGKGPPAVKLTTAAVRYSRSALSSWLETRAL